MRSSKFYFKNEKDVMRELGLKPVPGSGSGWIHKEDGESESFLVQLKSTDKNSIRIQRLDIDKLEYHAAVAHKIPVFVIQFLEDDSKYLLINVNDASNFANFALMGNEFKVKESEPKKQSAIIKPIEAAPQRKIAVGNSEKYFKERAKEWEQKKKRK